MPGDDDLKMAAAWTALTTPGGAMALGKITRFGRSLPIITTAPPTLPTYFAKFCALYADAEFLVAHTERLTFAQVYGAATAVARALTDDFGVRPGDRVAIAARNSPSWIAIHMGILMAGGIATLLNGWWQGDELAAAVADVDCRLVLADPPRAARLSDRVGPLTRVVSFDDALSLDRALAPITRFGQASGRLPWIDADDPATILFTSGSTGSAKGVLSTHRQVLQAVYNYLAQEMAWSLVYGLPEGKGAEVELLTVPLFHVTGEVSVMLRSFARGGKLVLMRKWNATEALRLIACEKVTSFVGVPLMSSEILGHPERDRYDLSSLTGIAAGGAPRAADHVRRFHTEMRVEPSIGYGLTETNSIGAVNGGEAYLTHPTSTGPATPPLVEIAILDEADRPVVEGALGEVCIRSAALFKEYWGRPADTAAAFTSDGFFRTGDIGYLDADGFLYIVDRKKDLIIRGGENIACQDVEAALYAHPRVAEAAVFGLPDERFGEVPGAVVHLSRGDGVPAEELIAFLQRRIAAFKVPQRIWLSEAPLPRLGSEKIDKSSLRVIYRAQMVAP